MGHRPAAVLVATTPLHRVDEATRRSRFEACSLRTCEVTSDVRRASGRYARVEVVSFPRNNHPLPCELIDSSRVGRSAPSRHRPLRRSGERERRKDRDMDRISMEGAR